MRNTFQFFLSFLISTAILLLGLYVLFGLDLDQWKQVKEVRLQLTERQAVMNLLTDLIAKFREKIALFDNLNQQIEMINTALPSSLDIPNLLVSIESMAQESEVKLEAITFTSIETASLNQAAELQMQHSVSETKPREIFVSITGEGSYLAIKAFVRVLETELRLIDIKDLNFSSSAATESSSENLAGRSGSDVRYSFQISANAYYIEKPIFSLP